MNNLVKFLILNFLILWSASLNADTKQLAYIKCDNLEGIRGELATRKRELMVQLNLTDKNYIAILSVYHPDVEHHFLLNVYYVEILNWSDQLV